MRARAAAVLLLLAAAACPSSAQTKKIRVMLVGDSLSNGPFGVGPSSLDAKLQALPNVLMAHYSACGTSPVNWINGLKSYCGHYFRDFSGSVSSAAAGTAETPKLADLMASQQPNLVLIQMGTNLIRSSLETSSAAARGLAAIVLQGKAQCVWIGPPATGAQTAHPMSAYARTFRMATIDQCLLFIDSLQYTSPPLYDPMKLHFTEPEVRTWVDETFKAVSALLPP